MINNLKNLGELGYYELSQRMSQMNRLLIDSTFYAWTPYFMNLAEQKSDNYSEKIVKRYFEIIAFFSILSVTFCFFSEEIVKLLTTTQFYPAMYLMPLMASQIFIQNFYVGNLIKKFCILIILRIFIIYSIYFSSFYNH